MQSDGQTRDGRTAAGPRDGYHVVFADGSDPAILAEVARLLTETARRGEAVGLPATITEAGYLAQLDTLMAAAARGDAGLAVALTGPSNATADETADDVADETAEVIATAQWTRSRYQTQQVLAEVDRVAVLPGRRGEGLGAELVTAVCEHARERGIEVLNLTVRGNNHAAIDLYERLGFRRAGLLPGVVAVGSARHDVVLMCRETARPPGLDLLGSLPAGGGASLPRGHAEGDDWVRTERLLLCRPTLTDADAHFAIHADPATNLHNPSGPDTDPMASHAAVREWARHWREHGYGYWTVRDPEDGAVLGFGGVRPPTADHDFLNLAYRFRPSAWGNGFATELGRAALALAAKQAPDRPVAALIRPSNAPSIRVAERLGLHLDGEVRRKDGVYLRYSIAP
jgi:ribosomal-protein-alanine N-acetyltransferase